MKEKTVWNKYNNFKEIMEFSESYKYFLDCCKTERETIKEVVKCAKKAGFVDISEINNKERLKKGDKVIISNNKTAALFVIGEKELSEGLHMICSHVDSPRLDIRANPFYEKEEMMLMKTHYYGGIKKYQWASHPLSLHGIIIKKGGEKVEIALGEHEDDPIFYISDLPKHLSANQSTMTMENGISGEDLNIISASIGADDKENGIIERTLKLFKERYKIEENDFVSAELEIVPAGKARDVGFDSSMIAAYGHDDRVCVYTSLKAILEVESPFYTSGTLFVDKEEIGSVGHTGMNSNYLEDIIAKLCFLQGKTDIYSLKKVLNHSKMISADVTVGMDSNHSECFESNNTARIGKGPAIMKYAGHHGKKACNDASAEFVAYIRDIFDKHNIKWQTGEMGRIDLGGGGTMAPFAANFGMEVLDCGVALLGMHAPYELASKADIYETYRAYKAFLLSDSDMRNYK